MLQYPSVKPRNNHFIEKSILGAVAFFKYCVYAEEYAVKKAFLQSLDPRIKILSFAIFIITVLFLKTITPILFLYCLALFLALVSKIDLVYFLERTWIFIPLFSLFIAVPALFSVFSPGEAIFAFKIFNVTFSITRQGLMSSTLFICRVITSVSIVVLLSLTTRHSEILATLRIFRIPPVFIMTINMCYRYIYLFAKIVEETFLAMKARSAQAISSRQGQRIASWNISSLWQRSFYLHKEVYNAMVSRGYSGQARIANDFKTGAKDWYWLAASVLISAFLLFRQIWNGPAL